MSVQIEHIILHQLVKENDTIEIVSRQDALSLSDDVENMVSELNRVYNLKNKAYGLFNDESQFAQLLKQNRSGEISFVSFTQQATSYLRNELIKYPFASGGVVVFCLYRFLAVEYLLVALLDHCDSMRVNESLEISTTHYLDISHLDIAARISLTEWDVQPDSPRYLTFLKGRVGRKVADFFMDYLSASEGFDKKEQNKQLLSAVEAYCDESQLDKEEKNAYRKDVYRYCQEQMLAGEEISVADVSQALTIDDEKPFTQFLKDETYQLDSHFPADRGVLRQFTKYVGSGGGISLSFDVDLLGDRIHWNPETDSLTIKGLPPNLRDQLKRRS